MQIEEDYNMTSRKNKNFPIVAIGASAGGLAAFEAFFSGMPDSAKPDMSFVLVQHLAPDHKSILTEIIRKFTRMQVFEVEDGMTIQPNCTYIIPPGKDMALLNGTLQLLEPSAPRGRRLPIDFFFRSMSEDQHEQAIGIILSGTGTDGTLGIRAIKEEGGMVMVQSAASAEHDGMPNSAIATGLVDYELPPAEMPSQLIAYVNHAFGKLAKSASSSSADSENILNKIFILLRTHTGNDFSSYKHSTVHRRIERRMGINKIDTMENYLLYAQETPSEIEALFQDMLIGVTKFFRDSDAFSALEKKIVPKLFDKRSISEPIRIWIPGCSTGEEAYSIAILVKEKLNILKKNHQIQVFATDIDSKAIDIARKGVYPEGIAADVSQERLACFFTAEDKGNFYRIHKNIRDMMIFSEQNAIKDPPFSKLDLISCRNLMIYLDVNIQKKLISLFNYALKPGGFLFLGNSETVGEFNNLYDTLDRKAKIYQSRADFNDLKRGNLSRLLVSTSEMKQIGIKSTGKEPMDSKNTLRHLTEQTLLQQTNLSSALINEKGDILYLHGRTGKYLELPSGEFDRNILKMARVGLKHTLTTAIHKVVRTNETIQYQGLQVKTNGDFTTVNLSISPVETDIGEFSGKHLYLVILEEVPQTIQKPDFQNTGVTTVGDVHIEGLKAELRAKEEYLQAANEELETSNESLRALNEEMQSVNEELQSTNEELETSKEELQSVNEELTTVNSELQIKLIDLSQVNNDMNNLLAGTNIATVFVDYDLNILRFTPATTQIINLIATDVGRSVGHVVTNLVNYDSLSKDVKEVLDTLKSKEIEVQTKEGRWYTLRINPYRTLENVIEGAVIIFIDIDQLVTTRETLYKVYERERLAVVVGDSRDAITVHDLKGQILAWNSSAERLYGWNETEALEMNVSSRIPEELKMKESEVLKSLSLSETLEPYKTKRIRKDGSVVEIWMIATALVDEKGKMYGIATTERITEA
jgi:two-component system CheB/CheR fusion protein